MGAGIAAGPHCPRAEDRQAWRGETAALGGFEHRRMQEPGVPPSSTFRVHPGLAPVPVPAGSPSGPGPWRFAAGGWTVRRPFLRLRFTAAEALVPQPAKSFGRSRRSAWR